MYFGDYSGLVVRNDFLKKWYLSEDMDVLKVLVMWKLGRKIF